MADLSLLYRAQYDPCEKYMIWTGNDEPLIYLFETSNLSVSRGIIGVGDVNNDGLDDYVSHYGIPEGTNLNSRIVLYYGIERFPVVDSLVITEDSNRITIYSSSPLGDLDNDGFADFSAISDGVWFGGQEITETPDLVLIYDNQHHDWTNLGYNRGTPLVYGDLNGDGYDDIIGSCYLTGYYDGEVGLWLGGQNIDGNRDLILGPPSDYPSRNFGWSKATGDFKKDGLCDLAVSAPIWGPGTNYDTNGKVFIYTGNAALDDTVVSIDDPVETSSTWDLNVYPNPVHRTLNLQLLSSADAEKGDAKLQIYNLKGQRVFAQLLPVSGISESSISVSLPELKSGVHFLRLSGNKQQVCKKICIVK